MTRIVLAALLGLAPPHDPPAVPPVGGDVDRSFEIVLPASIEGPTVTVTAGGAHIVVARGLLEEIAARDRASWTSEEERQELIAAGRGKALLAAAAAAAAVPAEGLGDAAHLLAQILEAGRAAVIPPGSQEPARRIVVRYRGTHPAPHVGFGRITFLLLEPEREFFSVSWFAA